jgi:chitin disaccharide deacetylase
MSSRKRLIVNADDFGQSAGVNRGILRAHRSGIVTSASLMVRWPAAPDAVERSRECPQLGLGLHVDFGEWVWRDGGWTLVYQVVELEDLEGIEAEVWRQVELFRRLTGKEPDHIDSHQHVHVRKRLQPIFAGIARALGVPLRKCTPGITYCGRFYGQTGRGEPFPEGITPEWLIGLLAALSGGVTELGCHPAEGRDVETMYNAEREKEIETLCDPRVLAAVAELNIELCSFQPERRNII